MDPSRLRHGLGGKHAGALPALDSNCVPARLGFSAGLMLTLRQILGKMQALVGEGGRWVRTPPPLPVVPFARGDLTQRVQPLPAFAYLLFFFFSKLR